MERGGRVESLYIYSHHPHYCSLVLNRSTAAVHPVHGTFQRINNSQLFSHLTLSRIISCIQPSPYSTQFHSNL